MSIKKENADYLNQVFSHHNHTYFISFNKFLKQISVRDTENGKIKEIISLKNYDFNIAKFVNFDSIFLINKEKSLLYLVNGKAELITTYNFDLLTYSYATNEFYESEYYDNSFFIKISRKTTYDEFYNYNVLLKVNLTNHTSEIVNLKYPSIYTKNHNWGGIGHNFSLVRAFDNNIVVSFPMMDSLYLINENRIIKKFVPRSKYLSLFPPKLINHDSTYYSKYVITYQRRSPFYAFVAYSQNMNWIYRIVAHSQEEYSMEGTFNLDKDRSFSIQIIDKNYQVIDESFFPSHKYVYSSFVVTNDGFALQRYPNENDSIISWDFFKLR